MENEEIKIKNSKFFLIAGIIILGAWLGIEIIIIQDAIAKEMSVVAVIVGSIYPSILLGLVGIMMLLDYFKNKKKMNGIMDKYGEEKIIQHIRQNTILIYQKEQNDEKVYFTNMFVVEPTEAIIPYSDISWVYKHVSRHDNIYRISIAFVLLDESIIFLCHDASDEEIENIMKICKQYNPCIACGRSNEAVAQHGMNRKLFRKGLK